MIIGLCCFGIDSEEERILINKINIYIKAKTEKDWIVNNYDLSSVEKETVDVCLCFGGKTKMYLPEYKKMFLTHSLSEMIINPETKPETFKTIEEMIKWIKEDSTKVVAVEKDNISFGAKNTDILITEEEATHIARIKEILGPGQKLIHIEKGDLKLVIEY